MRSAALFNDLLEITIVKSFMKHAALAAAFSIAIASGAVLTAQAGAGDYEFQLLTKELKSGPSAEIAVRLVHKPDGKPVPGAIIFSTRLDMGPDGMGSDDDAGRKTTE